MKASAGEGSETLVPGDEAGFAAVVAAHQSMVYSLARFALHDEALAEEVAQDVFFALYRHRGDIESSEHLVFWLRQVTVRRCIDCKRRRQAPLAEVALDGLAAPARNSGDPWVKARMERMLAGLPRRTRMMVLLRYQEEMTAEEIAGVMRIPAGTVKSTIQRALERLRRSVSAARLAPEWASRKRPGRGQGVLL